MKCCVMHPCVPCLQKHDGRRRHQTAPLFGVKKHDDKENAGDDKAVDIDEVPNPRDTDRVPIAGRADKRRNIASIVFCSPDASRGTLSGVNRIRSLPGLQSSLKYRRGWSTKIESPLRISTISKRKLKKCQKRTQRGEP